MDVPGFLPLSPVSSPVSSVCPRFPPPVSCPRFPQKRSRLLAATYRSGMALDELQQAREMTQVHLAKILGVNQAAVSKLERRADMYVTTLQDFVKAMGGELKSSPRSRKEPSRSASLRDVKKAAAGRD